MRDNQAVRNTRDSRNLVTCHDYASHIVRQLIRPLLVLIIHTIPQMPFIGFNSPSQLIKDDEADPLKEKILNVVSVGEADATASVADGSPLNHFPLVRLDVDVITDSMAGRLATNLLGHVLFLKNQIPL